MTFPQVGTPRTTVTQSMGIEPTFDGGRFQVYEWTTNRNFVVSAAPIGVPIGMVAERNSCRLVVEFDENNQTLGFAFSDRSKDGTPEHPTAFDRLQPLRQGAVLEKARRLNEITGLEKQRFLHPELTGAPSEMRLSSGGDFLFAVDRSAQGWVVDLRSDQIVDHFEGVPVGFWDMRPPGALRITSDPEDRALLVTQFRDRTRLLARASTGQTRYQDQSLTSLPGFLDAAFPRGRNTILGLETDTVVEFNAGGEVVARHPLEGLLAFSERGPVLEKPIAPTGSLIAVRLKVPSITNPDLAIVFSREGRGVALLDVRNDFARASANRGYQLSPDGSQLIVNKLSHVEVWNCADLVAGMMASAPAPMSPAPRRVLLLPFTNRDETWRKGHAPIAMSSDGKLLAVGGLCAVSVWDSTAGRPLAVVGPVSNSFPTAHPKIFTGLTEEIDASAMYIQTIAIDPLGRITVVFVDYRNQITIASWLVRL